MTVNKLFKFGVVTSFLFYLFYSRFIWVVQWSSFHVFRHQMASNFRYLVPVMQHTKGQMFFCCFAQFWKTSFKIDIMFQAMLYFSR